MARIYPKTRHLNARLVLELREELARAPKADIGRHIGNNNLESFSRIAIAFFPKRQFYSSMSEEHLGVLPAFRLIIGNL